MGLRGKGLGGQDTRQAGVKGWQETDAEGWGVPQVRQGAGKELSRCIHRAWGRQESDAGPGTGGAGELRSVARRVVCQEGSWAQLETAVPAHAGPSAGEQIREVCGGMLFLSGALEQE